MKRYRVTGYDRLHMGDIYRPGCIKLDMYNNPYYQQIIYAKDLYEAVEVYDEMYEDIGRLLDIVEVVEIKI